MLPRPAAAQSWPAKPIRVISRSRPARPSTSSGIVLDPLRRCSPNRSWSRTAAPAERSNRRGRQGDPDGYTILINASAHSAAPAAYPNVPYDTARDFSPSPASAACPRGGDRAPEGRRTLAERWPGQGRLTFASGVGSDALGRGALRLERRLPGRACRSAAGRSAHRDHDGPGRLCASASHRAGFIREGTLLALGCARRSGRRRCRTCHHAEAGYADSDCRF